MKNLTGKFYDDAEERAKEKKKIKIAKVKKLAPVSLAKELNDAKKLLVNLNAKYEQFPKKELYDAIVQLSSTIESLS